MPGAHDAPGGASGGGVADASTGGKRPGSRRRISAAYFTATRRPASKRVEPRASALERAAFA